MSDEDTDPEAAGSDERAAESEEPEPEEAAAEATGEGESEGEQPAISEDEQATIPDDLDPDDIEEETAPDEPEETDGDDADENGEKTATEPDGMGPDTGNSLVKAGDMYVSVVRSVTNAQIRKYDGDELDRDHFEKYDLAENFNNTMDQLGVGSDLEPHEALLLSTVLSIGDGVSRETDIVDEQLDRLIDRAMGGDEVAA